MLAVLGLAALISLMPEHQHNSATESSSSAINSQVLAQKQPYLLRHKDATRTSLR